MDADLLIDLKARLPAANDRQALEKLAQEAAVPYHTLLKIVKGETSDPRISTVQRLHKALARATA